MASDIRDVTVQARIDAGTAEAHQVIAEAETWRAEHNPAPERRDPGTCR